MMRETWYGKVSLLQMRLSLLESTATANGNSAAHAISLAASESDQTHPTPAKASGIGSICEQSGRHMCPSSYRQQ